MCIGIMCRILYQINLEGFQQAAEMNTLFGILVSLIVILVGAVFILFKKYEEKSKELNKLHENTSNRIDQIRKEIIEKNDEVNKHWKDSEKETLMVLKGVNSVLEMSEKMKDATTEKITDKLQLIIRMLEELKINGKN